MRRFKWIAATVLSGLALMTCNPGIQARKIRTKLPVKTAKALQESESTKQDQIRINENDFANDIGKIADKIRFYGFDKTVNSSTESFFISNTTDSTLTGVTLDITYHDMQGRQLHRWDVTFDCNIPPGETKRQDVKSWDTQKSFYHHQSAKPRRQATPFKVKMRLKSAILTPTTRREDAVVE